MDQSDQTQYPISGHPEHQPMVSPPTEHTPLQEIVEPRIPEELNSHIEHYNPAITLPSTIPLQTTTTAPLSIPTTNAPTLPLTEIEIEKGLKSGIMNSVHALALWCIRQLQIRDQQYKQK